MSDGSGRRYRAGDWLDDRCRVCKQVTRHTVLVANPDGTPIRVICEHCDSQHNFRGGGTMVPSSTQASSTDRSSSRPVMTGVRFPLVSERERSSEPMSVDGNTADLEMMLRRVIREETGLTSVTPADKWRGGDLVLRPGREGVQEKTIPIETFFNKVVMLRNRLRTLEQQVNAADLPQEAKVKIQGYITACYGSLTSFNVLFADDDDRFRGSGGS